MRQQQSPQQRSASKEQLTQEEANRRFADSPEKQDEVQNKKMDGPNRPSV